MGVACSTHGRHKYKKKCWSEKLNGRGHYEDLRVDGKTILEWMLGK